MLYVHILTSGRMLLTLGVHVQRGLPYLVCVCVSVCVYLCVCLMPYFLDTVSLYVEMKVSMASVQHGADFYKCLSYGSFVYHKSHQAYCSDPELVPSTA